MSDNYLNLLEARNEIETLGFKVTTRQIRRWASNRALPFFRLGKLLYIEREELRLSIKRLQVEASKRVHR